MSSVSDKRQAVNGGSWDDFREYVRCASHLNSRPVIRSFDLGFRLLREKPEKLAKCQAVHGGSWGGDRVNARCACYLNYLPEYRNFNLGFRLVHLPHHKSPKR